MIRVIIGDRRSTVEIIRTSLASIHPRHRVRERLDARISLKRANGRHVLNEVLCLSRVSKKNSSLRIIPLFFEQIALNKGSIFCSTAENASFLQHYSSHFAVGLLRSRQCTKDAMMKRMHRGAMSLLRRTGRTVCILHPLSASLSPSSTVHGRRCGQWLTRHSNRAGESPKYSSAHSSPCSIRTKAPPTFARSCLAAPCRPSPPARSAPSRR